MPKDKLEIIEDDDYPAISFEEAKKKAGRAINNIDKNEGISLNDAFDKVTHSKDDIQNPHGTRSG